MKALLFDLDGTLLHTIDDLHQSTNFALKKFGYPQRTREEVLSFVGNGLKMLIYRALPSTASQDEVTRVLVAMKQHYADHCHDYTVAYEGIYPLLQECKNHGIPMAIVSNKAAAMVKLLHKQFFADLIPLAVGECEGIARKPAPDMVKAAMQRLGVNDAYYIGDSDVDIQTAKNAGLPCLSVCWGFRSEEFLRAAGATELFSSPAALLQRILRDDSD